MILDKRARRKRIFAKKKEWAVARKAKKDLEDWMLELVAKMVTESVPKPQGRKRKRGENVGHGRWRMKLEQFRKMA
jgi:hypothetical protein